MRRTQKFRKITTVDLSYVVTVKYTMEKWQNFVVFSEYTNFTGYKCKKHFYSHELTQNMTVDNTFGAYDVEYVNTSIDHRLFSEMHGQCNIHNTGPAE